VLVGSASIKRKDWARWVYLDDDGTVVELWPSGRKTVYEPTISDLLAYDFEVEEVFHEEEKPTSPGEVTWVDRR
jgi:hypothetical protein